MAAEEWVAARLPSAVAHFDIAACGRVSHAVLEAQITHLSQEPDGAYVLEQDAEQLLASGRGALAELVGLGAGDAAYVDSGAGAFALLLASWPLARGARVGTTRSEFGSNARVLRRLAELHGWDLVVLPADGLGRVTEVPTGLDLVAFPHVASQRGVVQPVEEVLAQQVPVILDVAQSLGQTAVPAGCAAYVGTSRKWLCGPRGVGFLVVAPRWHEQLIAPPTLLALEAEGMRRFETHEGHVAGRVGLSLAAQEWSPDLLGHVHAKAAATRAAVDGAGGWRVIEPTDEPTGITTLAGGDPFAARRELLRRGFLTTAISVNRAEEVTEPVLRVSTAAWITDDDIAGIADALASVGSAA